ncbi:hypothetical protein [Pleionea mediterranea]|uniref:Uncharacterized protein n=1 Tax=Pleionea mediterranea TaxID=523701 RepID=A0A316FVU5_9GAMM|nr:hypothetical protein [Pleionea mediterranea]PWK52841.1 hypothetical protein C8D97_10459 [Pleionea mediterranea]
MSCNLQVPDLPYLSLYLQQDYLQVMPVYSPDEMDKPITIEFYTVRTNEEKICINIELPQFLVFQKVNQEHMYWHKFVERLENRDISFNAMPNKKKLTRITGHFKNFDQLNEDLENNGFLLSAYEGDYSTNFNCRLAVSSSKFWQLSDSDR